MERISNKNDIPDWLEPLVHTGPGSFLVIDNSLYLLSDVEAKEKGDMREDPCPKGDEYDLPAKIQYERASREKKRRELHDLYIRDNELFASVPDGADYRVKDKRNFPLPEKKRETLMKN